MSMHTDLQEEVVGRIRYKEMNETIANKCVTLRVFKTVDNCIFGAIIKFLL